MSMYNTLFGQNPLSEFILATLGLTKGDIGRFRDCFITEGEVAIYTRLGGGNRECYCDELCPEELAKGNHCCYQPYIEKLQAHSCYLKDENDDFDTTYATFYLSFPKEFRKILEALDSDEPFNSDKRWQGKLSEIEQSSAEELKTKYPGLVAITEEIVKRLT